MEDDSMYARFAAAIGTLVLASPARADHSSVHATASGEMATTDNLFATGSGGDRQADVFLTVRPGVLYAYDAPQMIHDFTAEAEATEYLLHAGQPVITGSGSWKSLFFTGPRSQLTMSINAATGLLSALTSRTSSDQTVATVVPSGKVDVQQMDTAEALSWISSKHTRTSQGVFGRYGFTDDGAGTTGQTREIGGNLGIERTFQSDTIALDALVSYLQFERIAPPGAIVPSRLDQQLNPRGRVTWRHDIDRTWSASADGGVVFVHPVGTNKYNPSEPRMAGTFSVFGAQLGYTEAWGRALLAARRDVSPNVFLAQNTVDDTANLQVAMPLPWLDDTQRNPKLAALGSIGIEHTQLINAASGSTEGNFKVAHLDLTLGWTPTPGQTYGVRYEIAYQTGDATALMAIPSFYRNTLYFTFSLRYPDRVIGQLPKRPKGLRSDRKDLAPIGGDTEIPDLLDDPHEDSSGASD
jgi:hypothetical protein